jgi:SpoVK/Ycf46/Vps4 family AAA+-type ATPase
MAHGPDVDEDFVASLAARAVGLSGAEIVGLCREAALACLQEMLDGRGGQALSGAKADQNADQGAEQEAERGVGRGLERGVEQVVERGAEGVQVEARHLEAALRKQTKSITPEVVEFYRGYAQKCGVPQA